MTVAIPAAVSSRSRPGAVGPGMDRRDYLAAYAVATAIARALATTFDSLTLTAGDQVAHTVAADILAVAGLALDGEH